MAELCPECDISMALFGPPLSGPWFWECPRCAHREDSGKETPKDRIDRRYRSSGENLSPAGGGRDV